MHHACSCGSGKPFSRCHGDPRNEYARVQALAEARTVAGLFPAVRPASGPLLEFADRAAAELGAADEIPDGVLDEGLRLAEAEGEAILAGWTSAYPDRWSSLCRAAGDKRAAEREAVKGAFAAAISDRQPTPPELIEELERAPRMPPGAVLALVLPPQAIWSYDEARAAAAAARGRPAAAAFDAVQEVAFALMRHEHVERLRALASRAASELPRRAAPRASRLLAHACPCADADTEFARGVLALTLSAYATLMPNDPRAALN